MSEFDLSFLDAPVIFRKRPVSVPADLRPLWRIYILLLFLRKCCRQNRSSFARLHVLSWAVLLPENRESLLAVVNDEQSPDSIIIRVEPSLNRAVDYAIGAGLIRRENGNRFMLTPTGITAADQIEEQDDCLTEEKAFMDKLGKKITETLVDELFV